MRWQVSTSSSDLLLATLGGNNLLRLEVDEKGARHREMLIEDLGRLRDVEIGPAGEVLLLVEHRTGSIVLRMDPVTSDLMRPRTAR